MNPAQQKLLEAKEYLQKALDALFLISQGKVEGTDVFSPQLHLFFEGLEDQLLRTIRNLD